LETKPISVTKEVYKKFIMEKVLPAIEEKWPQCHRNMAIKLQQDNAKPHRMIHDDPEVLEQLNNMTLRVNFFDQPTNSPDLNVLDLRYFAAIQALQQKQHITVDDLSVAVDYSFLNLESVTPAKCFVTLQKVMELVILHDGSNHFKLPQLGKDRLLLNRGMVLDTLPVSEELVEKLAENETQAPMAPAATAVAPVAPGAVDV
jgi:hypothetical protein